jgi:hypothetical protein
VPECSPLLTFPSTEAGFPASIIHLQALMNGNDHSDEEETSKSKDM